MCAAGGLTPLALAEACLEGGARLLQLRAKSLGSGGLLALADAVVAAARPHGARVVVNDRADVARMAGADGVHVGQDDLSVEDVRLLLEPAAIVGLSTHTPGQVDAALGRPATYVAVGPVFGTATKDTGYEAVGLERIRYAAGRGLPVVAIGGITLERVPRAIEAGAASVAVISDLLVTGDPASRVRDYLRVLS